MSNAEKIDPLVGAREAAKRLGVCETTVWRWRKAGLLPSPVTLGGRPRWRLSVIEALKDGAMQPKPAA